MNLYTYVGNDPVNRADSTGLYERDVHYQLTLVLARAAGFSLSLARQIAAADQGVDDNPATSPMKWSPVGNAVTVREAYHFTSVERRQGMYDQFRNSKSPKDLGVYLHAEQDAYSHLGYGPRFGHVVPLGKLPDKTWFAPEKADAMAADTYNTLTGARGALGERGKAVPYSEISGYVDQFNRAMSDEAKQDALNAILKRVGPH